MKSFYKSIFIAMVVSLVGACGGGSSDGMAAQVLPVKIDANNAAAVSSDALNAAEFGYEMSSFGDILVLSDPGAPGAWSKLGKWSGAAITKILVPGLEVTYPPETFACSVSGTVTYTATLADPFTITVGDWISIDFALCDDGDGVVMDGYMDFTVTAFAGSVDTQLYHMAMAVNIQNLTMDDGGDVGSASVNGDFTLSVDTMELPVTTSIVSGQTLALVAAGRSLTMKQFTTTSVVEMALTFSVDAMGKVRSSRFEGEASYETIAAFTGAVGDNPSAGEMLITGDGSSIRLIVLDNIMVRLQMDYNGDGTVDESRDLTWDEAIN